MKDTLKAGLTETAGNEVTRDRITDLKRLAAKAAKAGLA